MHRGLDFCAKTALIELLGDCSKAKKSLFPSVFEDGTSIAWLIALPCTRGKTLMTLGRFSEPRLLVPQLTGKTQVDVIRELAGLLHLTGRIDNQESFLKAVLEREASVPTLIDRGVAFPHARGCGKGLSMAVGRSEVGIPWSSPRNEVHFVFLFAVPTHEMQAYLAVLGGLSTLIEDEMAFDRLRAAERPEDMQLVLDSVHIWKRMQYATADQVHRGGF